MRRLRETIQRELDSQIGSLESETNQQPPVPPPPVAPSIAATTPRRARRSSTSATHSPVSVLDSPAPCRKRLCDASTQTMIGEDYVPIVEYLDREIPVPVREWHPGPLFVSPHGDTFHVHEHCWGLRNTRHRALRMCQCCRDTTGDLYEIMQRDDDPAAV